MCIGAKVHQGLFELAVRGRHRSGDETKRLLGHPRPHGVVRGAQKAVTAIRLIMALSPRTAPPAEVIPEQTTASSATGCFGSRFRCVWLHD